MVFRHLLHRYSLEWSIDSRSCHNPRLSRGCRRIGYRPPHDFFAMTFDRASLAALIWLDVSDFDYSSTIAVWDGCLRLHRCPNLYNSKQKLLLRAEEFASQVDGAAGG